MSSKKKAKAKKRRKERKEIRAMITHAATADISKMNAKIVLKD